MCINTKIQQLQQQRQELDAKIAKLEQFDQASSTVRSLLENLIEEYQSIAPEELNDFLEELLAEVIAPALLKGGQITPFVGNEYDNAFFENDSEPSAEDIDLVEQYRREPNNPIPQEAAEAIESALEENKFGFPPDPVDDREKESRDEEARSREDDFAEFVKISNAVGYLKRRDNGLILSGYIGLSNKIANGERATTMAHNRARKWADYLSGDFDAKCEVRKPKRMESDNSKAPFAYEVKFSGLSIGQITQLGKQNFDLLPYEEEERQANAKLLQSEVNVPQKTFSVAINGYSFKSGGESEVRNIFEEEILNLSPLQLTVDFYEGATRLERWNFHDLSFTNCADFDELNPEYNVHHAPSNTSAKVWSSLRSTAGKTERFWRHNLLQPGEEIELHTREAAAVHAIRRQQSTLQV